MLDREKLTELAEAAIGARKFSYAPYSHFSVGAALLLASGEIVTGSNIENLSYPAGLCAERVAIFAAAAKGHRTFRAIAVSGGKEGQEPDDFCLPCGMCLQAMTEFCSPDFEVDIVKNEKEIARYTLADLLPHAFTAEL